MVTLAYEVSGNHSVNPFPIDFVFPKTPVILTATSLNQINLFRKLGRLTFITNIPNIGRNQGNSYVIYKGSQNLNTAQLIDSDYQAEFYLYGYVPGIKLQVWY